MTKQELEKEVKYLVDVHGNSIDCVYEEAVSCYKQIQKFKTFDKELEKEFINKLGEFEWDTETDRLGWEDSSKGLETDYATFYKCYDISKVSENRTLENFKCYGDDVEDFCSGILEDAEIFYIDDYNIFQDFSYEAQYKKAEDIYERLKGGC